MKSIVLAFALLFTVPSFADLVASPSYINFGAVEMGGFNHPSQIVFVRNTSNENVQVMGGGYCDTNFYVANSCMGMLPPYGSCSVRISYQPHGVGYHSCNLSFSTMKGMGAQVNISGSATVKHY